MARNWKDVREDAVRAGLDEQAVENARKEMLDEVRAYIGWRTSGTSSIHP